MAGQFLAAAAGLSALKSGASAFAHRLGRRAALTALIGLLWLVAFGFALSAATLWLAGELGIIAACAIVAAVMATVALAIQLGMAADAPQRPAPALAAHADAGNESRARSEPGEEESSLSDETVLASTVFVSLAGYLLGRMVGKR